MLTVCLLFPDLNGFLNPFLPFWRLVELGVVELSGIESS
jgi:hypothetical protein